MCDESRSSDCQTNRFNNNNNDNKCSIQPGQFRQQSHSSLSLEETKRTNNCCSECSTAPPPPYGRMAFNNAQTLEPDEQHIENLLNVNNEIHDKRYDRNSTRKEKSLTRRTRFRSCQDLQFMNSNRRYFLLTLDDDNNLNGELCSSYPSVTTKATTTMRRDESGSKERLGSLLRLPPQIKNYKQLTRNGRELQEIVVHRLITDNEKSSISFGTRDKINDRLPEIADAVIKDESSVATSSFETNSSSSSEAEAIIINNLPVNFTSV